MSSTSNRPLTLHPDRLFSPEPIQRDAPLTFVPMIRTTKSRKNDPATISGVRRRNARRPCLATRCMRSRPAAPKSSVRLRKKALLARPPSPRTWVVELAENVDRGLHDWRVRVGTHEDEDGNLRHGVDSL